LNYAGDKDGFISKLDSSGNFMWAKGLGGIYPDFGNDILVDASGNIFTTGGFTDTVDFDPGAGTYNLISNGGMDIFISKLDSSGNFVWAKQAGGAEVENSRSLTMDIDGYLYVTGSYSSPVLSFVPYSITNASIHQSDIFIAKLDRSLLTGIGNVSGNSITFCVFPNPFSDKLNVLCKESVRINVLDLSGRLIYSQKITTDQPELNTTNWTQGVYFIEMVTAEESIVKKVVKQ
jgi:hypothetical protein